MVVDCVGINRSLRDAELSGAQLPLIERGRASARAAARRRPRPGGDRRPGVELVPGLHRAMGVQHAHHGGPAHGRARARRRHRGRWGRRRGDRAARGGQARPAHGVPRRRSTARARRPCGSGRPISSASPADESQGVAGLGRLRLQDARLAPRGDRADHWDAGLGTRATPSPRSSARSAAGSRARWPSSSSTPPGATWQGPCRRGRRGRLRRTASSARRSSSSGSPGRVGDPARRIVLGPGLMGDPALLRTVGAPLHGATGSTYDRPALMRAYLRRYAEAFPGTSRDVASSELVTGYRDAVEAIVRALERAGGDRGRLRAELARLRAGAARRARSPRPERPGRGGASRSYGSPARAGARADRRAPGGGPVARRPAAGLALPGQPPGGSAGSGRDGDAPGEAGVLGARRKAAGTEAAPD